MGQHPDGFVGRQSADAAVRLVPVDRGDAAAVREVDARPVVIGESGEREGSPDLHSGRVSRGDARERFPAGTRCGAEHLVSPGAELAAAGVIEPPQRTAVGRQCAQRRPVGAVGGLHGRAARHVPGEEFEGSRLIRHEHRVVRIVARGLRQRESRRGEPAPPPLLRRRVVEQAWWNARHRMFVCHGNILPCRCVRNYAT